MSQQPKIVLASSSKYRLTQLKNQFKFNDLEAIAPDIDETPSASESPAETALRLSELKAAKVASHVSPLHTIIAGDQTASFNNHLLKKPGSHEKAFEQLTRFSGQRLTFYSGICARLGDEVLSGVVETHVIFRQLTDEEIEHYLKADTPYDCVGAFKNESLGICLFDAIESQDPSALTGVPLIMLNHFLLKLGINILRFK